MDLSKEDPQLVERYGKGNPAFLDDGAPRFTENFLIARRLVEAGARVVSLNFSRWDWHGANFRQGRSEMPMLDQAASALIEDLENRGMLNDVSIVIWGEFGRTPQINKDAGRDHWPRVSCALLAGGGMRTGQAIGESTKYAEEALVRPIDYQEVHATLLHNMGINPRTQQIQDPAGRPQYLLEMRDPIAELV
jgi:hypothetical protein